MKKIVLMLLCLNAFSSFGQKHLEILSYEDFQNSEVFTGIRNGTTLSQYIAAHGSVLKLGDTLKIGVPSGSTTNTTAVGIGGTIGAAKSRSKSRSSFATIILGKPAGVGNILNAMSGEGPYNAGQEMQGEIVVISEMSVSHKGSKKKPLALQILLGEPNGRAFGINKYLSVTDYEKAVLAGEIKSLNAPLTRDEAIAKLKESKDLLDLGLLDEKGYEKLKAELTPIIMGK